MQAFQQQRRLARSGTGIGWSLRCTLTLHTGCTSQPCATLQVLWLIGQVGLQAHARAGPRLRCEPAP
jgi:hypothetical protein